MYLWEQGDLVSRNPWNPNDSQVMAVLREILKSECGRTGLTQTLIAARAGISMAMLSDILAGHKGFSVYMADRILGAIGRELVVGTRPSQVRVSPVKEKASLT